MYEIDDSTRFEIIQNTTNAILKELRHLPTTQIAPLVQDLKVAQANGVDRRYNEDNAGDIIKKDKVEVLILMEVVILTFYWLNSMGE